MNFIVENIDFFGFNKIVNFVMLNTALSLHTHTHTHTRRFDYAQRPVVPIIRFRLLSGAEISGCENSISILKNIFISYSTNTFWCICYQH
jgi:hypothetical protein